MDPSLQSMAFLAEISGVENQIYRSRSGISGAHRNRTINRFIWRQIACLSELVSLQWYQKPVLKWRCNDINSDKLCIWRHCYDVLGSGILLKYLGSGAAMLCKLAPARVRLCPGFSKKQTYPPQARRTLFHTKNDPILRKVSDWQTDIGKNKPFYTGPPS